MDILLSSRQEHFKCIVLTKYFATMVSFWYVTLKFTKSIENVLERERERERERESVRGAMDTVVEVDMAIRVQIIGETVCVSHRANTLEKGMNPIILPPAMGKIVGHSGLFSLCMATDLEVNFELEPLLIRLV